MCSVISVAGAETRQYDALGSVAGEAKNIDSLDYQTEYDYDRQGNQVSLTNPDGSQVKNIYNTAGQLEQVQRKEASDADFTDIVTDFDYGPHGQVTYQANANGTATTNTYDAAELYRLRNKRTELGGGGMGMGAGGEGGATFTAAAFYEAAAVPAAYDISQTSVARDYNQAPLIKQVYELTKAAFVKPTQEADGVRIEVGDVTKDEFIPELHINRWGNEATFKISPNLSGIAKSKQVLRLDNNVISLRTPKQEYRFYDIAPGVEYPEGAYEFEVVLPRKPQSNVVTLAIKTKNLSFYYQPPLNQEQQGEDVASCTETQCVDTSGNIVVARPENTVGSYAVYHSTKQGDYSKLGGHNYRSGKAFHIYRPKIVDAAGAWVWGRLAVDDKAGTLSITVPQSFLNSAKYPVIVDPTFGYTAMGASGSIVALNSAGTYYSTRIGHPYVGNNGSLESINVGLRLANNNGNVVDVTAFLNIRDTITNNHTQVAAIERESLSLGNTSAWYSFVAAGEPLTSGNVYIMSAVGDGSDLAPSSFVAIPMDLVTTLPKYSEQKVGSSGYLEAKENPWAVSASTYNNYVLALYVTYTGTVNAAPTEPTSLLTEGQVNPVNITDTTPEFSAIYNDSDAGDMANRYQVQVSTIPGVWTNLVWDSGQQAMAVTPQGTRSPNIQYAGPALTPGITYYWRIKFWDDEGAEGAWSTSGSSFSFFSDPNTMVFNSTPGDGYTNSSSTSSWDVAHDATIGSGGYHTYTYSEVGVEYYSSNYRIYRSFVPFDTSALPDSAVITDVALKVRVNSRANNDNDGDDWLTVVQTTQSSPLGLTADDYDQVGSVNNPIEGIDIAERKDLSAITTGQYLTFALNATGRSWISKTGYTKLGLREGHDAVDSPVSGSDYIQFGPVESDNPPILQVAYTLPSSNNAPTASTALLTEGQTNPVNITDTTPEFSAIYNDPDVGDIANLYQIQVSATPGVWTSPVWDSGQMSMSVTTQGTRSPDISYAGSSLTPGATYYWRIKFWDDDGAEGAWSSGSDTFTMSAPPVFQDIQNLTYTYDANGNITRLVDASQTNSAKTVDYSYDALNRLLTATATGVAAGQTPYSYTYSYDPIGNILTRVETIGGGSPVTYTYSYSSAGYANPHAVTDIAGTAYAYDNNGNLVAKGGALPWYPPAGGGGAWTDRKQLTINHTKVSGGQDLADFPMLVSVTDVSLKHTSYGGKVGKTNGTDILFTLSDGLTKLNHELESYTASTGKLEAWVRVPMLSASADTTLIIYYGNAAATDQQNKAGTWNSNYVAVYHNSTGTAGENDSTGSAYHLTEAGTVKQTTAGKVSKARQLTSTSTSNYLYRADAANLDGLQQMTYQVWVRKTNTSTSWYGIMSKRASATNQHSYSVGIQSNKVRFLTGNAVGNGTDTTTISVASVPKNTWTAVSAVFDGSQTAASRKKIYLQGVLNATGNSNITAITNTTSQLNVFRAMGQSKAFVGQLDEVRILKTALTPGWIATEYANQNSPSTFYTLGSVSGGSQDTFTWDYNNRLTSVIPAQGAIQTYAYDASGQRVKVISGEVTTVYPTQFYNTDGTAAIKHIMANGVVATVKGTGAGASVYSVSTDHLTGSNVVTTSTGVQEELMDYYPFGAIRLDEKVGTFSEQRKFTGQEYDVDTGLSYMNARYYDGAIARFISQDPLEIVGFQTTDQQKFVSVISNPQNWNTYSYALNNPLVATDPSGLLTIFVPGTNYDSAGVNSPQINLQGRLASAFNDNNVRYLEWNGGPNDSGQRSLVAQTLANAINGWNFADGEKLNIVAFSHGGNIVMEATHMLNRSIDQLVTLGTPVTSNYQPKVGMIDYHLNVSSLNDDVQRNAGNTETLYNKASRMPFGKTIDSLIGIGLTWYLGGGETGYAGKVFAGANNKWVEKEYPAYSEFGSVRAHTQLWQNSGVWNNVVLPNILK